MILQHSEGWFVGNYNRYEKTVLPLHYDYVLPGSTAYGKRQSTS
jgi:hypothetical protein